MGEGLGVGAYYKSLQRGSNGDLRVLLTPHVLRDEVHLDGLASKDTPMERRGRGQRAGEGAARVRWKKASRHAPTHRHINTTELQ